MNLATSTELSAVIILVIVLLAIAGLGLVQRRIWVPGSVAMLALGLCLGLLARSAGAGEGPPATGELSRIAAMGRRVSPDLILFVLLPPLVYEASHRLNPRRLWKNLGIISALALPVLLLTAGSVAVAVSLGGGGAFGIDWRIALLLGVILAATDPVAVVAAFRELGVAPRLVTIVEGESLCNDGTAIVLHQALCVFVIGGSSVLTVSTGVDVGGRLVVTVFGGLALGALTAWAMFRLIGDLAEERVEISVSVAVAYASFVLAEHVVGVSGVLATLAAGLVAGSYGRHQVSPAVAAFAARFWNYAAGVVNALIFFLVGLVVSARVSGEALISHVPILFVALAAIVVSRALGVVLVANTVGRFNSRIDSKHQAVMVWGGLRGGVSLALALHVVSLPGIQPEVRDTVLVVTSGVVFATLLLCGTSIGWLVERLGLAEPTPLQALQVAIAEDVLAEEALTITRANRKIADELKVECEERRRRAEDSLRSVAASLSAESLTAELLALSLERSAIEKLLAESEIDAVTGRTLSAGVDHLEDALHTTGLPMNRAIRELGAPSQGAALARGVVSIATLVVDAIVRLDSRVTIPGLDRVLERYEAWREQADALLHRFTSPEDAEQRSHLTRLHAIRAEVARTAELERSGLIGGRCAKELRIKLRERERAALRLARGE